MLPPSFFLLSAPPLTRVRSLWWVVVMVVIRGSKGLPLVGGWIEGGWIEGGWMNGYDREASQETFEQRRRRPPRTRAYRWRVPRLPPSPNAPRQAEDLDAAVRWWEAGTPSPQGPPATPAAATTAAQQQVNAKSSKPRPPPLGLGAAMAVSVYGKGWRAGQCGRSKQQVGTRRLLRCPCDGNPSMDGLGGPGEIERV